MSLEYLFDPLFRLPLATGLLLALMLPPLGLYLRLREEWLAALGYAHLAGAAGVLAPVLALPVIPAALAGGLLAALVKGLLRRRGNDVYALLTLLGWCATLLAAAHSHDAALAARAFIDGQLYFAAPAQLASAVALGAATLVVLRWSGGALLRERLFPWHDGINSRATRGHGAAFDLLVALAVALASSVMGVMAAFALSFVPAWVAYALAPGWRWAMLLAALLGVVAYVAAFVLALGVDLPFGPVLVAVLVLLASLRLLAPARLREE